MEIEIVALIIGIAAATFLTRSAFVFTYKKIKVSGSCNKWMAYIPIAIFTTILVPALLLPEGELDISIQNEYLIAGAIVLLVASRTRSLAGTVVIGISVILFLRYVLGF